jgi:hypothetical protein
LPLKATHSDPEAPAAALAGISGGSSGARPAPARFAIKDGVRLLPRLNRAMSTARVRPEVAIREITAVCQRTDSLMARRTCYRLRRPASTIAIADMCPGKAAS